MTRFLSAKDVADELGVPISSAYRYMRTMKRTIVGKHVRVARVSFDAWLRQHESEPAQPSPFTARARQRPPLALVEPVHITKPRTRKAATS